MSTLGFWIPGDLAQLSDDEDDDVEETETKKPTAGSSTVAAEVAREWLRQMLQDRADSAETTPLSRSPRPISHIASAMAASQLSDDSDAGDDSEAAGDDAGETGIGGHGGITNIIWSWFAQRHVHHWSDAGGDEDAAAARRTVPTMDSAAASEVAKAWLRQMLQDRDACRLDSESLDTRTTAPCPECPRSAHVNL